MSLTLIEVEGLERIQTSLGQRAVDAAVRELATRMTDVIGTDDLAARLGDHTFAVLAHHDAEVVGCTRLAATVIEVIIGEIALPEGLVRLTATAGCTVLTPGLSVEDLVAQVEVALDEGRTRGLERLAFDPSRHARALRIRELEHELEAGLERGEFRVHYQPLVDLTSQNVVGFEALVRWSTRRGA